MNIHDWKFKKKKSGLFKKTKWKKNEKKMVLKKNGEKKKSRSAILDLLCKVSGMDVIWKEKIMLH